jgi:deoxycytidylate deaminase
MTNNQQDKMKLTNTMIHNLLLTVSKSTINHSHASMILDGNRPIIYTYNSHWGNISKHAEENAINRLLSLHPKVRRNFQRNKKDKIHKKYTLVVIRYSNKSFVYSHPCPKCMRAINECGMIKKVIYS